MTMTKNGTKADLENKAQKDWGKVQKLQDREEKLRGRIDDMQTKLRSVEEKTRAARNEVAGVRGIISQMEDAGMTKYRITKHGHIEFYQNE